MFDAIALIAIMLLVLVFLVWMGKMLWMTKAEREAIRERDANEAKK